MRNPFSTGSVTHWLLEMPVEYEFKEYDAILKSVRFEKSTINTTAYYLDVQEGGVSWAVGGVSVKDSSGDQCKWANDFLDDVCRVFDVQSVSEIRNVPVKLCLWHLRSVAVRNPVNGRLHFPEEISEQLKRKVT